MSKWKIKTIEEVTTTYTIEADDEEEAIALVLQGKAYIENQHIEWPDILEIFSVDE